MSDRDATLSSLQSQMDLAAIEVEVSALVITMAGAQGIHAFELVGPTAIAVVWEPLDPVVAPSCLRRVKEFELGETWEPDDFFSASLTPLSAALMDDLSAAGTWSWFRGDANALANAPGRFILRIEGWQREPDRADLCLVVGAADLRAHDEDGEIPLVDDDPLPLPRPASGHVAPPPEAPFELSEHDAPDELVAPLRSFFELHHAGRWRELARIHPRIDSDEDERAAWLAAHFIDIHEWGYARAVDEWWREGDLACVRIRGIQHCVEEDTMDAHAVECVWSFSLRLRGEQWIVRNWSQAWPNVGGAPELELAKKPWLLAWKSGTVE